MGSNQPCTIIADYGGTSNSKEILIKNITTLVSDSEDGKVPFQFSLSQNYPDLFNPSTHIRYGIPKQSFVALKIYNERGMEVESIVSEGKAPGEYEVEWHAEDFPSGIYLCRLEAGHFVETRKLIFLIVSRTFNNFDDVIIGQSRFR
ncbi:T9SS type A sorting domain-containing protein [bacterium]|nr:T9SS type A sorting domain-containing protein [bacterium]